MPADVQQAEPSSADAVDGSGDEPVLILSPHYDDAVLSAYALLTSRTKAEIVTVFTGSPATPRRTGWDRMCGFADSTQAIAARRVENDAAMRGMDVVQHSLDLVDAQYLDGVRPASDAERIESFVASWLKAQGAPSMVAAPAGAGRQATPSAPTRLLGAPRSGRRERIRRAVGPVGRALLRSRARVVARRTPPFAHPDHLTVRDAAVRAVGQSLGHGLVLYEDLPYLWGAPADAEVAQVARRLGAGAHERGATVDRDEKAARVAAYDSQLRYMYRPHGDLGTSSGLPDIERYWSVS